MIFLERVATNPIKVQMQRTVVTTIPVVSVKTCSSCLENGVISEANLYEF